MNTEALKIWKTTVPDTWIDYNAHMTEGYYGVAFAEASDELYYTLALTPTTVRRVELSTRSRLKYAF